MLSGRVNIHDVSTVDLSEAGRLADEHINGLPSVLPIEIPRKTNITPPPQHHLRLSRTKNPCHTRSMPRHLYNARPPPARRLYIYIGVQHVVLSVCGTCLNVDTGTTTTKPQKEVPGGCSHFLTRRTYKYPSNKHPRFVSEP